MKFIDQIVPASVGLQELQNFFVERILTSFQLCVELQSLRIALPPVDPLDVVRRVYQLFHQLLLAFAQPGAIKRHFEWPESRHPRVEIRRHSQRSRNARAGAAAFRRIGFICSLKTQQERGYRQGRN